MFLRRLFNYDTLEMAVDVVTRQNKLIQEWQRIYASKEAEIYQMRLDHMRNVRDLVNQFLICQEEEIDVREELEDGLCDLNDHVARLEEHTR